ncbi:MAG: hypothetical protein IT377_31450 [Polyangiaceae bacterium]|nr:hypothetical protein [Polyangiaceae bacterium]
MRQEPLMVTVVLSIEPDLCGPVSVGTVRVIRTLEQSLGLCLADALAVVNRAVFDGETVHVPAPDAEAARRCVAALATLPRVRAEIG